MSLRDYACLFFLRFVLDLKIFAINYFSEFQQISMFGILFIIFLRMARCNACFSSQDIDCMPFNPLENMPASLTRHNASVNKLFENFNELKIKFAPSENLESSDGPYISPSSHHISNLLKQVKFSTFWNLSCVFCWYLGCCHTHRTVNHTVVLLLVFFLSAGTSSPTKISRAKKNLIWQSSRNKVSVLLTKQKLFYVRVVHQVPAYKQK